MAFYLDVSDIRTKSVQIDFCRLWRIMDAPSLIPVMWSAPKITGGLAISRLDSQCGYSEKISPCHLHYIFRLVS